MKQMHDEALFKQPPRREDCPICFLRMPSMGTGIRYRACCGKVICSGCIYAPVYDNNGDKIEKKCPLCRAPTPTSDEEVMKRMQKRVEVGDAQAIYQLGVCYSQGMYGLSQDYAKALELWHRAEELGCAAACCNIGYAYSRGEGVEGRTLLQTRTIGGVAEARYNLGVFEEKADNYDRAAKHFLVAVVVRHLQKMHMCVFRAILTPLALWTQQKLYLH